MRPEILACAALHHWAYRAATGVTPSTSDADALLHRTAWLVTGEPRPSGATWPELPTTALRSIFSRIERGRAGSLALMRPATLALERERLFPTLEASGGDAITDLRRSLAQLEARHLPPGEQLEGLLFALERHAWALASPLPAVSLYDFARTHAALAAALAADPDGELLLLGGDLSGVQDFIYSVSASGAARQLRGRSLYLQLLTDACAHALLEAAVMPRCNLLYAGGGSFYLLLPATMRGRLDDLRRQIGSSLLTAHHGALYLALGAVTFRPEAYTRETWQQLSGQIDQDKRRRFATLDEAAFARLFVPQQPAQPRTEDGDEERVDRMAESLEQLGGRLQRASILALQPDQPYALRAGEHTLYDLLAALGLRTRLLDDQADQPNRVRRRRLLALTDGVELDAQQPGDLVGVRYTATEAPIATEQDVAHYHRLDRATNDDRTLAVGQIKPFSLLAEQSQGVKRMGVLRMDVDDLGELFGVNLDRPDGVAALAVTAALSAALSRFFEGWVDELCRQKNAQGRGGVMAIYSGGDDLFLLGSWDLMPSLARQIRDDFATYILGRPLQPGEVPPISLSAGITLIGAVYPIYQAAADAAEALDAAKAYERERPDKRRKDAISFLGRTLGWEQFREVEQLHSELVALIEQRAPRALLMTLQQLDHQAQQRQPHSQTGRPQFNHGPWVWQGAYQLTRLAERAPKELRPRLEELRERIVGREGVTNRTIERAGLAARWAQLSIRNRSSQREQSDDESSNE